MDVSELKEIVTDIQQKDWVQEQSRKKRGRICKHED